MQPPSFANPRPSSPAAKRGIRYERKVHDRFLQTYGLDYIPSQWFSYGLCGQTKYCQVDGILLAEAKGLLVLVEVKYNHTADAYWQLENLYLPVLRTWLHRSPLAIATVEVVKWYDPAVAYPRRPVLVEDLMQAKPGNFSVHILNR